MSVLRGQHVHTVLGGLIDNPNLTGDHWHFTWVNQSAPVPFGNDTQRAPSGQAQLHWPVEANARTIKAQKATAFVDDFYYTIHVSPSRLDLGNVASAQSTPVYVFNAHFEARTLSAIEGLEEGLTLTGQPATPLLVPALTELMWSVSVTPNGQPVLDASVIWNFGNETPSLQITANRIIAWTFAPDWADGVREQLSWATDVLQSESGVEQRRSLRVQPRREFQASMYVEGRERQYLEMALFGWSARVWALPVWPDVQLITGTVAAGSMSVACDTQYLDFQVGSLALFRGESAFDSESVEVESISLAGLTFKRPTQQSWSAGTRLYPMRSAQLTEMPTTTRLTDKSVSADVQFLVMEACSWPAVMPATVYRNFPVFEAKPDESEDLTSSYQRLLLTLDNGSALPLVTDTANRAFPVHAHRWLEMGRAARSALRSFAYALNGRQKAVWTATHADDLQLLELVPDSSTTLEVANVGYSRFASAKPGRRDIRIELWNGTAYHRRITAYSEVNNDIERLVIDSALGRQIAPGDVMRICWLTLCRLDSDTVEIEHQTDSEGIAAAQLIFRGVRDDEF